MYLIVIFRPALEERYDGTMVRICVLGQPLLEGLLVGSSPFSVPRRVDVLLVMNKSRGSLDCRRSGAKVCVMTWALVTLMSQALAQPSRRESSPLTTEKSGSRP